MAGISKFTVGKAGVCTFALGKFGQGKLLTFSNVGVSKLKLGGCNFDAPL
jgi:hypothetical protein